MSIFPITNEIFLPRMAPDFFPQTGISELHSDPFFSILFPKIDLEDVEKEPDEIIYTTKKTKVIKDSIEDYSDAQELTQFPSKKVKQEVNLSDQPSGGDIPVISSTIGQQLLPLEQQVYGDIGQEKEEEKKEQESPTKGKKTRFGFPTISTLKLLTSSPQKSVQKMKQKFKEDKPKIISKIKQKLGFESKEEKEQESTTETSTGKEQKEPTPEPPKQTSFSTVTDEQQLAEQQKKINVQTNEFLNELDKHKTDEIAIRKQGEKHSYISVTINLLMIARNINTDELINISRAGPNLSNRTIIYKRITSFATKSEALTDKPEEVTVQSVKRTSMIQEQGINLNETRQFTIGKIQYTIIPFKENSDVYKNIIRPFYDNASIIIDDVKEFKRFKSTK